jgi:hypothetical protein
MVTTFYPLREQERKHVNSKENQRKEKIEKKRNAKI